MSYERAREAVDRYGNNVRAAAALGVSEWTIRHWLKKGPSDDEPGSLGMPIFVTDGDEDESIDDILSRQRKAFERARRSAEERRWFRISVRENKPYALLWFGDPHLGNTGCNWPLLERHIAICQKPGVYGANIGDTTDAWPWTGRLAKLWAEKDLSHKSERKLAEWFMFGAGINWCVWLLGNHDEWNGGTEFYKRLGANHIPVIDWRAQFVLHHPGGRDVRVDAAHGRKGSSIANPSHSTLRAARESEHADLFVTGHTHNFKLDMFEDAGRRQVSWLMQLRGYKWFDHYATVNGFPEYTYGSGGLSVIDPESGRIMCFADPEEGYEYLAWRRR